MIRINKKKHNKVIIDYHHNKHNNNSQLYYNNKKNIKNHNDHIQQIDKNKINVQFKKLALEPQQFGLS